MHSPPEHHRRSLRLRGYDYRQDGVYFVTICTYQRACLCGSIVDERVVLNEVGEIVRVSWETLPVRFPSIELDEFVVMPNHIHGIITVGAQFIAPSRPTPESPTVGQATGAMNCAPTDNPSLGDVVRAFKAAASRAVRQRDDAGFAWQRNYYEHIIRSERALEAIRRYIGNNPAMWAKDENNPAFTRPSIPSAGKGM